MADMSSGLSDLRTGAVVAPAGCGKTHLIAEALRHHEAAKPVLVLTHTNAGVAALRSRLDRAGVVSSRYRLATIDAWALRLLSTFPKRSGVSDEVLRVERPSQHYPRLRRLTVDLLAEKHLDDILAASYDRLVVDEYQDCNVRQHEIVVHLSRILSTVILGDPMQAIFTFGGSMPDWQDEVLTHFPLAAQLDIPWRWRNAGTEDFGQWLLNARQALEAGHQIDLRAAPPEVTWVHLDGSEDRARQIIAAKTKATMDGGAVLVIGDARNPASQQRLAAQIPGAVTVEAVTLGDLTDFASGLDFDEPDALRMVVEFADRVMAGVGPEEFLQRIAALMEGTPETRSTMVEQAALQFVEDPNPKGAAALLGAIGAQAGVREHRPTVLRACLQALQACALTPGLSFEDAAIAARERGRLLGRPLPARAVGSTLLLKGLEADVAVILDADGLDGAKNLYVAMTRGARRLVICSKSPVLSPH